MWGANITPGNIGAANDTTEAEWQRAHRALERLARRQAAADAEQGRWLLRALRSATHVHLGFSTFGEYVERMFGHSPRATQDRLRVAEALEQLPELARALEQGQLSWSAVRELTRVAVAETEAEWLAAAADKTVRQLEELVAGARPGDRPSTLRNPALRPRVLRFEVTAETFAIFREAVSQLRRRSDARLDDDAILLTLARAVLQGPSDEGRSSYQVSLSVCPECGAGAQIAAGELVPVGPEITAMAECDGQHIGPIATAAHAELSAVVKGADGDAAGADVDAHRGAPRDAHVGTGSTAEPTGRDAAAPDPDTHVGTPPSPRATQTIPPAKRRAVLQRDRRRCRVPGCHNATFVDVHHITARADGGGHGVDNLIVLCGAHHRAAHRGELVIEGTSADTVRFRHADGSPYGSVANPAQLDIQAKVFSGLRNMGFKEREVRPVLDALRRETGGTPVTFDALIRQALDRLAPCAPLGHS